jgi:hypothetical protein
MWASVRVLLWKNWRVKQRESRLNRGRSGRAWLFPALITDIVLPLALVLLLIRKVCLYNAHLATPSSTSVLGVGTDGLAAVDLRRQLVWEASTAAWGPHKPTRKPAALLLTALPLLLKESNQSLAIVDRQETREFISFLDRCGLACQ